MSFRAEHLRRFQRGFNGLQRASDEFHLKCHVVSMRFKAFQETLEGL